jgi:hypothetical protein
MPLPKGKTAKITVVGIVLIGVAGCCRPVQRFVPYEGNLGNALDTKTGQLCRTTPHQDGDLIPSCNDLYRSGKLVNNFKLGHYRNSPQLTTTHHKRRTHVLSTADWSVLHY